MKHEINLGANSKSVPQNEIKKKKIKINKTKRKIKKNKKRKKTTQNMSCARSSKKNLASA